MKERNSQPPRSSAARTAKVRETNSIEFSRSKEEIAGRAKGPYAIASLTLIALVIVALPLFTAFAKGVLA